MVGDLEAIGDAATGGVLGRAVEPAAGEGDGHTQERNCLNCGCALTGDYCHCCGQRAHVHRTLGAFWHDFLHSVLHVDGKFWRTMPMLAWKPGELTRRYAHGERARFISPLALFLFSVFLMFATFSLTGAEIIGDPTGMEAEISNEIRASDDRAASLQRRIVELRVQDRPTGALERQLQDARNDSAALRRVQAGDLSQMTGPRVWGFEALFEKGKQNPQLLFYKLQTNAYKFSWALIPLSVPFLWLLFLHRRRYRQQYKGYDHLVFITYSIAFMSLAMIAFVLVRALGVPNGILALAMTVIVPLHIYRQLRGAYSLSSWSAIWRTLVLLVFASTVLGLFMMLLLAIGVLA